VGQARRFRIQASAGPVGDKALEEIIFGRRLSAQEPRAVIRGATGRSPPSVVRILLTTFLENMPKEENQR
jgi:hypothetical protein